MLPYIKELAGKLLHERIKEHDLCVEHRRLIPFTGLIDRLKGCYLNGDGVSYIVFLLLLFSKEGRDFSYLNLPFLGILFRYFTVLYPTN